MPIYDYECKECKHRFEEFFPLEDWDSKPDCPKCGKESRKILTAQIQRDEPVWLDDSVRGALQDTDAKNEKPITNRTEYKRYLKDNGIVER